jgi:hypothetical protein
MRIHRVNSRTTQRRYAREIEILCRRSRRERIWLIGRDEGLRHICDLGRGIRCDWTEGLKVSEPEERRLAVELEIVFSLENVVENAEAAANTQLSAWRPRKTKARRPVVFVRKIRALRGIRITGEQDALWRIRKHRRLLTQRPGEGATLQIFFR